MTVARVPHDPNDLRVAATWLRNIAPRNEQGGNVYKVCDRLEAWADDLEREPASPDELVAALREGANAIYAYGIPSKGPAVLAAFADRMERLAPLEAAVLDALDEEDLVTASEMCMDYANGSLASPWCDMAVRFGRAADALHALEAEHGT